MLATPAKPIDIQRQFTRLERHPNTTHPISLLARLMEDPTHKTFVRDYLMHDGHRDAMLMAMFYYSYIQKTFPNLTPSTRARMLLTCMNHGPTRRFMVQEYKTSSTSKSAKISEGSQTTKNKPIRVPMSIKTS